MRLVHFYVYLLRAMAKVLVLNALPILLWLVLFWLHGRTAYRRGFLAGQIREAERTLQNMAALHAAIVGARPEPRPEREN